MRKLTEHKIALCGSVLGLALAGAALAQEQSGETVKTAPDVSTTEKLPANHNKKEERVSVTGSRIKRVESEGTAPITVVDSKQIEESGAKTVAELMRGSTASPGGNFEGTGGYVRSGAATADLMGIGSNRTLVLLDGKRLPVDQSIGAVNVNNIPVTIIERIEFLRGGASAVYGSDAVGGVVNIITKKGYTGNEASVSSSVPQHGGGEKMTVNALSGFLIGESSYGMVTAGYSKSNEIISDNRAYSKGNEPRNYSEKLAPHGTYSYRIYENGKPGNWTPSDNCPEENRRVTDPDRPNNVFCAGPLDKEGTWRMPRTEEGFVTGRAESAIGKVDISVNAIYNRKSSLVNAGNYLNRTWDPITHRGVIISSQKAGELGLGLADGQNMEIYTQTPEMADRMSVNIDQAYGGSVTAETKLGGWNWTLSDTGFKTTNKRNYDNVLNKEKEINLLHPRDEDGNILPAKYVPIDPNRDTSVLASIYDDMRSSEVNTGNTADLYASRDLVSLPGGKLSLLLGASFTTETYQQNADARDQQFLTLGGEETGLPVYTGTAAVSGRGDRQISSMFTELIVPAVKDLEIMTALRADSYSDFGQSTNFSVGSKYKVIDELLFRFNVASSYKAPSLSDLHQEGGGGYRWVTDEKWCEREKANGNSCPTPDRQIYVDGPGNKDLKEEKGSSYSIGTVIEPVRDVSLLVDYINVHLTNTFGTSDVQDVVDNYYQNRPNGSNTVKSADGIISSLGTPTQNLGTLDVKAVNTELNASQMAEGYLVGLQSNYFRYLSFKEQDNLEKPTRQKNGYKYYPSWRFTNTWSVGKDGHTMSLTSSTIAKQVTDPEDVDPNVPNLAPTYHDIGEYTQHTVAYSYRGDTYGFTLGVKNVMDQIGGRDNSGYINGYENVNTALYSLDGRTFFTGMSARF